MTTNRLETGSREETASGTSTPFSVPSQPAVPVGVGGETGTPSQLSGYEDAAGGRQKAAGKSLGTGRTPWDLVHQFLPIDSRWKDNPALKCIFLIFLSFVILRPKSRSEFDLPLLLSAIVIFVYFVVSTLWRRVSRVSEKGRDAN